MKEDINLKSYHIHMTCILSLPCVKLLKIHQEFTNICTNKCYVDTMILYGLWQSMRITPKNLPTNPPITQVVQAAGSLMDDLWDDRRLPWISTQGPILRTQDVT